ncbi:MAG: aromatic amino acid lyase, partial [Pikeienuella sp.]
MIITLSGHNLTPDGLAAIAAGTAQVALDESALRRMAKAREVIDHAVAERRPVYGVTTGLGPRVVDALPEDELEAFALTTVRGRAHSSGADLSEAQCRAALAVRLNTLLIGAAGVRPALAIFIADCLNAGLAPVIRSVGSIGAADLMWGGDMGLGLIGEGRMWANGVVCNASEALTKAGFLGWQPGPREGLALVSHSCTSAALAMYACHQLTVVLEAHKRAVALSLEGFRANLSALDPELLALRPQAGQIEAASDLADLLAGSPLYEEGAARRLQDPLSIRNIPQVYGAVRAALSAVQQAVQDEANGASDNPGVLIESGHVASHGGYLTPHLMITLGALHQSLAHMAAVTAARVGKMLSGRFTELPNGLTHAGAAGAGISPVMKTVEALFAEIAHAATPPPIYPGFSADGLEDVSVHSGLAAKATFRIVDLLAELVAIEMIVAAQAVDLRGVEIAPALVPVHDRVRAISPPFVDDRPLGDE